MPSVLCADLELVAVFDLDEELGTIDPRVGLPVVVLFSSGEEVWLWFCEVIEEEIRISLFGESSVHLVVD